MTSISKIGHFVNKPNNDDMFSHSLSHGNKFKKYQFKITKTEGFNLNETNDGLTPQSNMVLKNTDFSSKKSIVDNLKKEYSITLDEYNKLLAKTSGDSSTFLNRINNSNPFLNKTIRFTTGHIAYVTNRGVVKYIPSIEILNSTNIPKDFMDIAIPWDSAYDIPNAVIKTNPELLSGTPVVLNQIIGNEGDNIYVDKLITTTDATYQGCFADDMTSQSMSFIGGNPPKNSKIINGDFSQPDIAKNSYKYVSSIPGWVTSNILLMNNYGSPDWNYPLPYPNGNQCINIQKNQSISQTLNLSAGSYTLMFYACGRNCCDNSGKGNPIDVLLNNVSIFKFDAPIKNWTRYTTIFNNSLTANNTITFKGTWTDGDRSTAVQGVEIIMNAQSMSGNFTYDTCKQTAIDGGYQYFALQDVNSTSNKGYCGVSNDSIAPTSGGTSYAISGNVPLWSSNTGGQPGNTAMLNDQGKLTVLNSNGSEVFTTPNNTGISPDFIGCYNDKSTRALSLYNSGKQLYNKDECKDIAPKSSSKFYGIQNSATGQNAQCTTSNDLIQAIKYGQATNCTKINDGYSGGAWSNAVYSTEPSSYYWLNLQDDGNMCIYRGSGASDNQGAIWCSSTNNKQQEKNPNYIASKGKYGKNFMKTGDVLAPGDFIASTDGSIYLIMQADGNLVLYTSQKTENCNINKDGKYGGGIGANALYKLNEVGYKNNIGKLGYIDPNSELYVYPPDNMELTSEYTEFIGVDNGGNNIGNSYSGATLDNCKTSCNNDPNCYGFSYEPGTNSCYPKNKNIYPNSSKIYNDSSNLYVRKVKPKNVPSGISNSINNIDTIKYQNYIKTNTSGSYGLTNATSLDTQLLDQMKTKINLLANQINGLTTEFSSADNLVNDRIKNNTTGVEGFSNKGYLTQLNDTKKQIRTIDKYFDSILSDSQIVVSQKNTTYLIWSIVAIGTLIISMKVIRK